MEKCKTIYWSEVKAENLGRPGCLGAKERNLISEQDGAKNFTARIIEILPSGVIPPHKHEHEHCAFILEGKCTFVCGGKETLAKEGCTVFIPPNAMHSWHNLTNIVTTFLLVDI